MSSKILTVGDVQQSTVRDRIDKLRALLSEALDVEVQIIGHIPAREADVGKPNDLILDVIESDLDGLLEQAGDVVSQLKQVQRRLG